MKPFLAALLLLLSILLPGSGSLTQSASIPPKITPENAAQLTSLRFVGSALPGELEWKAGSSTLAVGTTQGAYLYDAVNPDQALIVFEQGTRNIAFLNEGEKFLSGNYVWDSATGQNQELAEAYLQTHNVQTVYPYVYEIQDNADEIVVKITDISAQTLQEHLLHTGMQYELKRVMFSPVQQPYVALVFQSYDYDSKPVIVQLWDLQTGKLIAEHPQQLEYLAFADFYHHGEFFVVAVTTNAPYGSIFDEVNIYDTVTGERVGPSQSISFPPVVISPNDQLMTFGSNNGIIFWSDHELKPVAEAEESPCKHAVAEFNPTISPGGQWFAGTNLSGEIELWQIKSGEITSDKLLSDILTNCWLLDTDNSLSDSDALQLKFSPDETMLALVFEDYASPNADGTFDDNVTIWSTSSGQLRYKFPVEGVREIKFNATSTLLHMQARLQSYLYDLTTGQLLQEFPVSSVLNDDWSHIAYWDQGSVGIVDLKTGTTSMIDVITPLTGYVEAFNPQTGQVIFRGSTLQGFDVATRQPLSESQIVETPLEGFEDSLSLLQIKSETDSLTSTLTSTRLYPRLDLSLDNQLIAYSKSVSSYGMGPGGHIRLWDLPTGNLRAFWETNHYGKNLVAFSPDGQWLASAYSNNLITLWDIAATLQVSAEAGDNLQAVRPAVVRLSLDVPDFGNLEKVIFSSDGSYLVAQADLLYWEGGIKLRPHNVYLWSIPDALAATPPSANYLDMIIDDAHTTFENAEMPCLNPDGSLLLLKEVGVDQMGLWDTDTGQRVATFAGNGLAAFGTDGQLLITATGNDLVIWKVADLIQGNSQPIKALPGKASQVKELLFNPEGSYMYARRDDGIEVFGTEN